MAHVSERKKPRRKPADGTEDIWVSLRGAAAGSADLRAKVVDASDTGLRIETPMPLETNAVVVLNAGNTNGSTKGKVRARVVWCNSRPEGGHYSGLAYEDGNETDKKPMEPIPDYYEVLQVHSKADPETIHRVYRLLAQRFHPDNVDTGNLETFRSILDAYKVLSDPEKRAAYDVNFHLHRQLRWRLFEPGQPAVGKVSEKSKRRGVLELLYRARVNQPNQPTMTIHELEDLLGCPREHLEFSLWYLKENALIVRADNGRYAITVKGVDWAEGMMRIPRTACACCRQQAPSSHNVLSGAACNSLRVPMEPPLVKMSGWILQVVRLRAVQLSLYFLVRRTISSTPDAQA